MSVSIRDFGKSTTGQTVKLAVLKNEFIEVQLLSYAAVIHRILVPDRKGNPVDVVLGYPTAADYELNTDSMGAAVGRFANRIAGAQFPLYEEIVHVTPNQNGNCLHSGLHGFNHTLFDVALTPGETDSVTMTAFSPAGTDGFPGNLELKIRYSLAKSGLVIRYTATTDAPTVCNMTNHSYFNLNGHASGSALGHRVTVDADAYLEADAQSIPTGRKLPVNEEARAFMKEIADGDGRYILNLCESVFAYAKEGETFDKDSILKIVRSRAPIYDKGRDGHYNLISAVHKSLRGSDVDAALYWAARMIEAGEDPKYLLRRLTRFAVEDVSLADPNAVTQAIACWETYERLGSPEGDLAIMQLVAYLATAPKSVGVYKAMYKARELARKTGSLMPPKNILNAPTKLMKQLGYSEGYEYDPDCEDGFSGANYFPDGMNRVKIYFPVDRGFEREIKKRVEYFDNLRREKQKAKKKEGQE